MDMTTETNAIAVTPPLSISIKQAEYNNAPAIHNAFTIFIFINLLATQA